MACSSCKRRRVRYVRSLLPLLVAVVLRGPSRSRSRSALLFAISRSPVFLLPLTMTNHMNHRKTKHTHTPSAYLDANCLWKNKNTITTNCRLRTAADNTTTPAAAEVPSQDPASAVGTDHTGSPSRRELGAPHAGHTTVSQTQISTILMMMQLLTTRLGRRLRRPGGSGSLLRCPPRIMV